VDRPNFGLYLDQYHVLSRLWADPRSESGIRPDGKAALLASLRRFLDERPPETIFYIRLSDAERLAPPPLARHSTYNVNKRAHTPAAAVV
jgi:hypothetical protein